MVVFDIAWLGYYLPIFGFLLVFTVMFAILAKTKILGDSAGTNLIVSFIFAIIFVSFSPGVRYVGTIVPWFVILILALFFVLMIAGLSQKELDKFMNPKLAWAFIGILIIIFLWSAIVVFNPFLQPGINQYSEHFTGAAILLVVAALASWAVTRGIKK